MKSSQLERTQIVVTALLTALLSFLVGIGIFHYSNLAPDLVFEEFPPSSFSNDEYEIGIYSAVLQNYGNKEAEEIQVYVELTNGALLQDVSIEPTSPAIQYVISNDPQQGAVEIAFSRLNQSEGARFTFLLNKPTDGIENISVRGKGVVGRQGPIDRNSYSTLLSIGSAILGGIFAIIALGVSSKLFLESNLKEVFSTQKRVADEELRVVRTKGVEQIDIRTKLLSSKYRLFYNPKTQRSKIIQFGNDGKILEGNNNNEHSWKIKNNLVEILDSDGKPHSRFYFSGTDNAFYHTNDPDTGSIIKHNIKDQYMVAEN